jgi:hypothetical protein
VLPSSPASPDDGSATCAPDFICRGAVVAFPLVYLVIIPCLPFASWGKKAKSLLLGFTFTIFCWVIIPCLEHHQTHKKRPSWRINGSAVSMAATTLSAEQSNSPTEKKRKPNNFFF